MQNLDNKSRKRYNFFEVSKMTTAKEKMMQGIFSVKPYCFYFTFN